MKKCTICELFSDTQTKFPIFRHLNSKSFLATTDPYSMKLVKIKLL